jgi:hypothetical protein
MAHLVVLVVGAHVSGDDLPVETLANGGDLLLAQILKASFTEQRLGVCFIQVTLQVSQALFDLLTSKIGHPLLPKQVLVAQSL